MRQKLGQHFLADKNILNKIAAALSFEDGDVIFEIGPGHGELTDALLNEKKVRILAIERDPALAAELKEKYAGEKRVEVKEGDAIKILPGLLNRAGPAKVTGNIPYYITGKLLRILGDAPRKPAEAAFTIQKEVALRVLAEPPDMNLLAASVQVWAAPSIAAHIPKDAFSPPPEVDSAILVLHALPHAIPPGFFPFIRILFKQPRKTVFNNLRDGLKNPQEEILKALHDLKISPQSRPQNLAVSDIKELQRLLSR